MPETVTPAMKRKWAIVSWRHNCFLDGRYGKLLDIMEGTYDEACAEARAYLLHHSPVSICGIIEP